MNNLPLIISLIALAISAMTFWLTRLKKGTVKMTRPTVIFFGPDGAGSGDNKVYIRTLLYSTSDRGQYVQNMFLRLQRGETIQIFNVWVYGDDGLKRGSGLFIDKSGIASNHHFLTPKSSSEYDFLPGDYNLQIFVETVNDAPKMIFEQKLSLDKIIQEEMVLQKAGIFFDWAPDTQNYFSHVHLPPRKERIL